MRLFYKEGEKMGSITIPKCNYETKDGYVDVEKLLGEISVLAYITGARSIGKTYGFLINAIEDGLENFLDHNPLNSIQDLNDLPLESESEHQFFFLRRTITEIKAEKKKLMRKDFYKKFTESIDESITKKFFLSYSYSGAASDVMSIYLLFEEKENRKNKRYILLGYMAAVSAHKKLRGSGYPVEIILYDEFQADEWHEYYKGMKEPATIMDIYESITRERAGEVPIICLGNSGTIMNPHASYYDYKEFEQEKTVKRNGTVIFYHLEIVSKNKKGKFKDLIEGTAYGDYSIYNKYGDLKQFNILRLADAPSPRKCLYNVELNKTLYGVWVDGERKRIISSLSDPELNTYVDRLPSEGEKLSKDVYIDLAGKIINKFLYFDSADIRLQAEKHLQRYAFVKTSSWETAK